MKLNFVNLMHRFPDANGNVTLDELAAAVAAETTVDDSADVLLVSDNNLIATLRAQILATPALTPEQQTAINGIFATAQANAAKLAKSITDNTPPPATA